MRCRFCNTPLKTEFIDLGFSPPSNSFLTPEQLNGPEVHYPLKLMVCSDCLLVQIDEYKRSKDIFNDGYVYFSSISSSWVEHARRYSDGIIERLGLGPASSVVEIAANDGYLLQFFKAKGVPCLGVEPCANVAASAREKGLEIVTEYFSTMLARKMKASGQRADLIIGNNVLAHVPDVRDFVGGMKILLEQKGVITMEFPHVMRLLDENQFDTIYHEHFSYFSLHTVRRIFAEFGLGIFDVEELPTHGGSLRIYAGHLDESARVSQAVQGLLEREADRGMHGLEGYLGFQAKADKVKNDLLAFLIQVRRDGRTVCGYGAAAKGNTLLNYAGVRPDLLNFVVDASPHKQGLYTPGMHIPVRAPEVIQQVRPDYVLVLPWNIQAEIMTQLSFISDWGGRFVVPIPSLEVI